MSETVSVSELYDQLEQADIAERSEAEVDTETEAEAEVETESEAPFNWKDIPQELLPLAKQFQADYTRKTQDLAAERRSLQEERERLQTLAALEQLIETEPRRAAELLREYAEALVQSDETGSDEDTLALLEPATETERLLLEEVRSLKEGLAQWQSFQNHLAEQAELAKMEEEFDQVSEWIGRDLTDEERETIAEHCLATGISNIMVAYKDLVWNQALEAARQAGRDEASAVLERKANLSQPSSLVERLSSELPKNDRELISRLYDELEAAG